MSLRESVLRRVEALPRGDVVAGSREEGAAADAVRGMLEEAGLSTSEYVFECMSWSEEHVSLHVGGESIPAVALPYTPSGHVEARIVYAGTGLHEREWRGVDAEGKVVLLKWFDKLDEAVWQYIEAVKRGASAVVIFDPYPGRRRRMVMTLSTDYRFGGGTPPYVPALSVSFDDGMRLLAAARAGRGVELAVESRVEHGARSRVVHAGDLEGPVFTAHMDKWLTGFTDNALGVALVAEAARVFGEEAGYVVFGSEESGAPGYSPWYWIWGSRSFTRSLEERGLIGSVGPVINFDVLGGPGVHVSVSGPGFRRGVERLLGPGFTYGWDEAIYDSFSFTMAGVPALTLNSYEYIQPVYHTDLDVAAFVSWSGVEKGFEAALRLGSVYLKEGWSIVDYRYLKESVREAVKRFSWAPEARRVLELLDSLSLRGEEEARPFRRVLSSPIYRGRYELTYRDFEYAIPYMLEPALDLESLESGGEAELRIIPGLERILPSVEAPFYGVEPPGNVRGEASASLRHIARSALRELEERLRALSSG